MTWPPILVDEDFPAAVARALRERGSSLVEITAEGARRGASDVEQVARAAHLNGVLVSHNQNQRGRFREYVRAWRARGNNGVCVLFLPHDPDPGRLELRTALLLDWLATLSSPKPETLVWNDVAQALIHGRTLPGYSRAEVEFALGQGRAERDRAEDGPEHW